MLVPLNNVRIVVSESPTIPMYRERASVGQKRGSSFLSSFFAYFFSNGKSMKKKKWILKKYI
jgi:hypothetical protein